MSKMCKLPKIQLILAMFLMIIVMISCGDKEKAAPDVSNIPMDVEFIRFDQELMKVDTNDGGTSLQMLTSKYPAFSKLYFSNIIFLQDANDSMVSLASVSSFINDEKVKHLQDTINVVMNDLTDVKKELNQAMRYYRYYFPERSIPRIYGCISGFDYQRFIFDDDDERDGIGLGLEMFLGNDFPYKMVDPKNPVFSEYLTRTFNKDHLTKKVMDLLVDDICGEAGGVRLIDQMIQNGKKIYLTQKLIPFAPDSILLEYTADQVQWCKENELEIWGFFFDKNLFYETSAAKINKYVNPSPNSPDMPQEAPGRTANYIGYKIIKAYMDKYPETTLEELINLKDAQKLLEDSKYKPKRK